MASRFFKRRWDDTRGDEFHVWGESDWYFEIDEDGLPVRQIEDYDQGPRLRYDREQYEDDYGSITAGPLDLDEFAPFEISEKQFEKIWNEP